MIVIIKYNAGNTQSVENAVRRLGYNCLVTNDVKEIKKANKIIFPGVGEAATAMQHLQANGLDLVIKGLKQPVLGICLGLQLMCNYTEEGNTNGLGIFDINVKKFPPLDIVPHTGWNTVSNCRGKLFSDFSKEEHFYFVHSYYAEGSPLSVAQCDYILPYSAALQKDNFYAVQFHPEKSGTAGEQLLKNFLNL
ncbi:imidazole glycerol phosphate synthase subunit HisH [Flavobacterium sp.]|uniref:imidazole glycerol phosphate synthase subunit HisH n=1 Tax=Flavobacterium sp. TaxID=239 RepID=UPI003A934D98